MAPYSVTLTNNLITDVSELDAADYDELGLEWALSELKDTLRLSGVISADFSLKDKDELVQFVEAVKKAIGPYAVKDFALPT